MINKMTFAFMIVAVAGCALAQDTAVAHQRQTAEGAWEEGKLTISYGAPKWRDDFKAQMDKLDAPWRMGTNEPTTAVLTSGLETPAGALPPGEYRLALSKGEGNVWSLLFYEAQTFYDKSFKTWAVPATGPVGNLATPAENLTLKFDDRKLVLEFGPYTSTWALKPIKVNTAITTEFNDTNVSIEVLSLPLEGSPNLKDATIGVATVARGDVKARYHIRLTAEGEKATLNFVNERAPGLTKEKEQFEGIITNIGKRLEENPERKEAAEPILAGFKQAVERIDALKTACERLNAKVDVQGTVTKKATSTPGPLSAESERPTGGLVLKLALPDRDLAFEIKPRGTFTKRRGE